MRNIFMHNISRRKHGYSYDCLALEDEAPTVEGWSLGAKILCNLRMTGQGSNVAASICFDTYSEVKLQAIHTLPF